MGQWANHNPELLDYLTCKELPQDWKKKVIGGDIELENVPSEILKAARDKGERDHFAGVTDNVYEEMRERE